MSRLPVKSVDGLVLALDPKKLETVVTLEGKNFLLDADGPRSAFGTSDTHRRIFDSEFVKSIKLGTEQFYFAHNSTDSFSTCRVYKLDWPNRQWIYQFEMPQQGFSAERKKQPWSSALVGGIHYVASLGFGLWSYNAATQVWGSETTTVQTGFGAALDIYSITAAAGRLCLLVRGFVWWSAIDAGTNVVPSTSTGAGFQNLALIGTPVEDYEYKGIFAVADGFLTFLESGTLKSTIIQSINPFRHDPVGAEYIPFNSNCVTRLDSQTLVLFTRTGFYSTDGRDFAPWQPLMSEHLKKDYVPTLSLNDVGQVQIHYDQHRQWFFLSLAQSRTVNLYSKAFALYLPRDQWGSFDKVHRAFVSIDEFGDNSKISLGYIANDGKLNMFADTTADLHIQEQLPSAVETSQNEVFYMEDLQDPNVVQVDDVTYAASAMRVDSNDYVHEYMSAYGLDWPTGAGFYETWKALSVLNDAHGYAVTDPATVDELPLSATVSSAFNLGETGAVIYGFGKQDIQQDALDATIDIGLFRLTDNENSQQITSLQEMAISMNDSVGIEASAEDWMNDFSSDVFIDWATIDEIVEDWGYGIQPGSVYSHLLVGTLDGFKQWQDQSRVFTLRLDEGKTQFFTGEVQGLYCKLRIEALEAGQSFHLKDLEFNGSLAGVI